MLEKVTKKSILFSIIFILLLSIALVNVLSFDNIVYADDDEVVYYNRSDYSSAGEVVIDAKNSVVYGNPGGDIVISSSAESVTLYSETGLIKFGGTRIIISPRNKDLYIYFDGVIGISSSANYTAVNNQSTRGTVHFVNNNADNDVIFTTWGRNYLYEYVLSPYLKDGVGVNAIFYTKGNVSFEGVRGFDIDGGGPRYRLSNISGRTCRATAGMQVVGAKQVYINTNVRIKGADAPSGCNLYIPNETAVDGGTGGYGFDGALARVSIADNAYLRLIGGNGGDGSDTSSDVKPGSRGFGGAPFYLNIIADKTKYSDLNGLDGKDGISRNK